MSFVCLWIPHWSTDAASPAERVPLLARLLDVAPRVAMERDVVWADARGLAGDGVACDLAAVLVAGGNRPARVGVAATPIAAFVASRSRPAPRRTAEPVPVVTVPSGADRRFLASRSLAVLDPSPTLANLLEGVGIHRCGELAALDRESVEIRFGAEGVRLHRLACADDDRLVFGALPRTLPEASLQWEEYAVRHTERLLFVLNALTRSVCDALRARGEGARVMTLVFSLVDRTAYEHVLRPARPLADPAAWMRLVRTELERIRLREGVTGLALRVESVATLAGRQGDLFDRGFATEQAGERALGQLLDDQGAVILRPQVTRHPLPHRSAGWVPEDLAAAASTAAEPAVPPVGLTLQLLPRVRHVKVEFQQRRDHVVPSRYCDAGAWCAIVEVAGPDRISGESWGAPFDRDYFRCVTEEGVLVWLLHDRTHDVWSIEGWWD